MLPRFHDENVGSRSKAARNPQRKSAFAPVGQISVIGDGWGSVKSVGATKQLEDLRRHPVEHEQVGCLDLLNAERHELRTS